MAVKSLRKKGKAVQPLRGVSVHHKKRRKLFKKYEKL